MPERTVLLRVPADEQGEPILSVGVVRAAIDAGTEAHVAGMEEQRQLLESVRAALRACPRVSEGERERYRWNDGVTQAERELRGATVARVSAMEDAVKKGLWTGHDECKGFVDGEGFWDGCTCGHDAARQALEELTELAYDATQEARAEKSAPREAAPEELCDVCGGDLSLAQEIRCICGGTDKVPCSSGTLHTYVSQKESVFTKTSI
jgi:hypothetical protein